MAKSSGTPVTLTEEDRKRLEGIMKNPQSLRKHAWRADIILNLGAGFGPSETRRRTGKSIPTVQRWRKRFLVEGVDGLLYDATRPPGRAPIPEEQAKALTGVAMSPPPRHLSHWTLSALAERTGMVRSTIHNILKRHGLAPTGTKTFKVSRDPDFERKIHDIVGLYVNPPERAVVLSVDEKPQIQALSRTQRPLPMKAGHPRTRTHDYRRNGTACLMAALDVATGRVVGRMTQRHRSREFISFLDHVAEGIDPTVNVHVILDNVSSPGRPRFASGWKGIPDGPSTSRRPPPPGRTRWRAFSPN